ncbi:Clp protease N-terminal domain-containing protein [Orbaceae bacterium ac157xtp]
MITDPSTLLRRLNPYCAKALESAAGLCQTRAHTEITLEHWLLKLLEQGNGDITVVIRHYQLDVDEIWQGLLNCLEALPHTINQKPSLSSTLIAVLQAAWLKASLEDREESIRSIHILQALQELPHCLKAQEAWQLLSLSVVALQKLRPRLDEISDESQAQITNLQMDEPQLNINTTELPKTAKKLTASKNSKTDSSPVEQSAEPNKVQIEQQQKHHQAALS